MYLGIDLGTTNTVVSRSFVDADDRLVTEIVQIGQMYNDSWERFPMIPSMVFWDGEECIVGKEAKRQREWDKENVITNAKRFMGTEHKWKLGKEKFEARDVGAMVLQHCRKVIEREGNMNYESVVITVPASFNSSQIGDTIQAAKMAGFKDEEIHIKHEPTAALLAFIDSQAKKNEKDRFIDFTEEKRVMVFDLGGGTCDTSIIDVQVTNDGIKFTEVALGRYQELGGIDWDYRLAIGMLNKFFSDNGIVEGQISEEEQSTMFERLRLKAEAIKEKISAKVYTRISSGNEENLDEVKVSGTIPEFYKGQTFRYELTKKEYDEYTASLYSDKQEHYKKFDDMDANKNMIQTIRCTLEDYDIKKESIDYVFVTGGMSQFPTVQEKLKEYIGKPIIRPENPMDVVARGASIYQYYKVHEEKKEKTNDNSSATSEGEEVSEGIIDTMMLAEAILLDMNEGLPKVIIPKKTKVPYSGCIKGEFRTSSPSGIRLNIYAAEDEMDSSMRVQRSLEKYFRFPVESGTPFDIEYTINENKAIDMKIFLKDPNQQILDISVRSDVQIGEKNFNLAMEED